MSRWSSASLVGAAIVFTIGTAELASADPITVQAGAAIFSAENDTVSLSFGPMLNFDVDFSAPFAQTFDLQSGEFAVNFSPSVSPPYSFAISRPIDIGGVSHDISQPGVLSITPSIDTLTLLGSSPTLYDLGAGRELFLTVEGTTLSTQVVGTFPFTLSATISSEPIPEPTTLTLVGIGIAGLVGHAKWRRSRRRIMKTDG